MNAHTVIVEIDDQKTSIDEVIHALNEAGFTVPKYSKNP
jgi:copper chaperone CopZ